MQEDKSDQYYRTLYEPYDTSYLLERSSMELTEEARTALEQILAERGLSDKEIHQARQAPEAKSRRAKTRTQKEGPLKDMFRRWRDPRLRILLEHDGCTVTQVTWSQGIW